MEKFGIYQILEALGRMNNGSAPAAAEQPVPPPAPPRAEPTAAKTEESPYPAPSYFNAKILEVMEKHDRLSKKIDRDNGK